MYHETPPLHLYDVIHLLAYNKSQNFDIFIAAADADRAPFTLTVTAQLQDDDVLKINYLHKHKKEMYPKYSQKVSDFHSAMKLLCRYIDCSFSLILCVNVHNL